MHHSCLQESIARSLLHDADYLQFQTLQRSISGWEHELRDSDEFPLHIMDGMQQIGRPNVANPTIATINPLFASFPDDALEDRVHRMEADDGFLLGHMQAQPVSTAPGPASATAIAALPRRELDMSMRGFDGEAVCTVCRCNVEIGDEVTTLPCFHWYHGNCVTTWLKLHDSCPVCRQGTMSKVFNPPGHSRSPGHIARAWLYRRHGDRRFGGRRDRESGRSVRRLIGQVRRMLRRESVWGTR